MMSADQFVEQLAETARDVNIVTAVAELPNSNLVNWFQDQTDAYVAWAGDKWTDEGLAAWIASRQAEMNAALRADVATVIGDAPPRPEIEAPDARAILAAAEAWERDGADLPEHHYRILVKAVTAMHGPFTQHLERFAGNDKNEYLARHRDQMHELFLRDLAALIKEARRKL